MHGLHAGAWLRDPLPGMHQTPADRTAVVVGLARLGLPGAPLPGQERPQRTWDDRQEPRASRVQYLLPRLDFGDWQHHDPAVGEPRSSMHSESGSYTWWQHSGQVGTPAAHAGIGRPEPRAALPHNRGPVERHLARAANHHEGGTLHGSCARR